jgi:hypothetical protein
MKNINADIQQVIDLYRELGLLETPDAIIWCSASEDVICKRLDSKDVAHHKYFESPQLIQMVRNEFAQLYEDKVRSGEVFLFETDKEKIQNLLFEYSGN